MSSEFIQSEIKNLGFLIMYAEAAEKRSVKDNDERSANYHRRSAEKYRKEIEEYKSILNQKS